MKTTLPLYIAGLISMATPGWIQSCQPGPGNSKPLYPELDVQGHRGCRGSLPENSVAGFLQALEWGVNTLEMDVVISKDHQVVVSHEPYISHLICIDSLGHEIDSSSHQRLNIYQMTYRQIQQFDCGSKPAPGFPLQESVPGPKPLLSEVIEAVEARRGDLNLPPVKYNIETKSNKESDGIFHPEPARFVELVLEVVNHYQIAQRTIIQSFDPRTLAEVRKQGPHITIAQLVSNTSKPANAFARLGFEPDIYSPHYSLVTGSMVTKLHQKNIAVIPWTVNQQNEMKKYIEMGVDGIITDYPELLLEMLNR